MTTNPTLQAYNSMSEEGRMNKLTTLQKLLKESTAGKWEVVAGILKTKRMYLAPTYLGITKEQYMERVGKDPEFIAEAHNSLPDILKALEIAMKALKKIKKKEDVINFVMTQEAQKYANGISVDSEPVHQDIAEQALQEITKLLND